MRVTLACTGSWVVCWVRNCLISLMLIKVKPQNWETEATWSQKLIINHDSKISNSLWRSKSCDECFLGWDNQELSLSKNNSEIHAGMSKKQFKILSETEGSSRRWRSDWGTVSEAVMSPEELWIWMERTKEGELILWVIARGMVGAEGWWGWGLVSM